MSLPSMKAFKWKYKINPDDGTRYYDIVNRYQTNPNEVIKSKIIIRLGTAKGEWSDDVDFGLPLGAIKQNTNNPDVVAQLISDEIFKVENVNTVKTTSKNIDASLRLFSGSFSVGTIFGGDPVEVNV